jgi:hypothetical protein
VNATDIGVADPQCQAHFIQKAVQPVFVSLETCRKKLQCHRLAKLEIIGSVDFTHPTSANQPHYPVATGKKSTG